jgi:ligand-binding SRPBCC domain-containing protein
VSVQFESRTVIAASAEALFDLSLRVDVHTESMAASGEVAIDGVTSGMLGLDDEVTWRARHFGIHFTMTSRITEYERPHRFVDEQVRGPFHRFRHEHTFVDQGDGTSAMVDIVDFTAPLGPIGVIGERVFLVGYLRALIEQRNSYIKAKAEDSA